MLHHYIIPNTYLNSRPYGAQFTDQVEI